MAIVWHVRGQVMRKGGADNKVTDFHPCPICSTSVPHQARYPDAVCPDCFNKACDSQGRKLKFSNLSLSGGFETVFADTDIPHPSHVCFIDGVVCWADEARFGGIVVQPINCVEGDR
jgi:hypothetical protein